MGECRIKRRAKNMIPNFPTPYPDELFHSVLARHSWLMRNPNNSDVFTEIYGHVPNGFYLDFPTHLGAMTLISSSAEVSEAATILKQNTMLPFYAPFLPEERVALVQQEMIGSGSRGLLIRAGIVGSGIARLPNLRFCPCCCAEERRMTGEAYWHRLPQLPGLHVCPSHNVFFVDSTIPFARARGQRTLMAAEKAIPSATAPQSADASNADHATLLRIAKSAACLTEQAIAGQDLEETQRQYLQLAMKLGYATATGCVNWTKLVQNLRKRYSCELLAQLYCALPPDAPQNRDHWISAILHKCKDVQAPIRHLLLMDFLGTSPAEFFRLSPTGTIFGSGPWVCDNPLCPKTGQAVIGDMVLEQSAMHRTPMGITTCTVCGQKLGRMIVNGSLRVWVRDHGWAWREELERLWLNPAISIGEIGRRFAMASATVKAHAHTMGLPPRRRATENGLQAKPPRKLQRATRRAEQVPLKRDEWRKLRHENPTLSTTELIVRAGQCYSYLYRHDRKWLKDNSPRSRRRPPPPCPQIDWNLRDQQLRGEVEQAVRELRLDNGEPQCITITAIGQKMGKLRMLQKNFSLMPSTRKEILASIESPADLGRRKVAWAARCIREEGGQLQREDLIRRANLSVAQSTNPRVVEAIELELAGEKPSAEKQAV
jgi:hypothetical protein